MNLDPKVRRPVRKVRSHMIDGFGCDQIKLVLDESPLVSRDNFQSEVDNFALNFREGIVLEACNNDSGGGDRVFEVEYDIAGIDLVLMKHAAREIQPQMLVDIYGI